MEPKKHYGFVNSVTGTAADDQRRRPNDGNIGFLGACTKRSASRDRGHTGAQWTINKARQNSKTFTNGQLIFLLQL